MDSLDVDLLNSLNVSTFSDLRPLPMLISYGTIRQFWPRNVTSAFQKCGFCRSKEIFSGPNPRGHLDFFSFTHTANCLEFPSKAYLTAHRRAQTCQWPSGPTQYGSHYLSYFISPSLTAPSLHFSHRSSHLTVTHLPQGLCTCCSHFSTSFRSLLKYHLHREAYFNCSI